MKTHRWTGERLAIALALLTALPTSTGLTVSAQTAAADAKTTNWLPVDLALKTTLQSGRPSVLVFTSPTSPASLELVAELRRLADSALSGQVIHFAEVPEEDHAKQAARLGVKIFPAVLVYGREGSKLKLVGHRLGNIDAAATLLWVASLQTSSAQSNVPETDPAVKRTAQDRYPVPPSPQAPLPSSQNVQGPPPAPPKTTYQPPPPPYQPMPAPIPVMPAQPAQIPPVYAAPMPQPVVVSTPATPVVVQPSQPQIIIGPSQAPQITFASAPSAPSVSYVQPANAPTPNQPQQIFMASAPPASAPPPPSNAPMMYAPVSMAPQPSYAPQPVASAPAPAQSPLLAAALLTNPRLWDRLLGALGEHLAQRRNPRLQMSNAPTVAQAPVAMAPVAGAPGAYAPVAQPAMMPMPAMAPMYAPAPAYGYAVAAGYGYGPPPGYCPPPPQQPYYPYPPPTAPSPQYGGPSMEPGYPPMPPPQANPGQQDKGGFFHSLFHH
jgi:hypothetical protein